MIDIAVDETQRVNWNNEKKESMSSDDIQLHEEKKLELIFWNFWIRGKISKSWTTNWAQKDQLETFVFSFQNQRQAYFLKLVFRLECHVYIKISIFLNILLLFFIKSLFKLATIREGNKICL
jgi:hypothetical protein